MAGSPRPVGRPSTFDLADVLHAASAVIERDGLAGCTLRAVAGELDVTAMALYRHVESKEHLLSLLPDHLVADVGAGLDGVDDGIDALRVVALELAGLLARRPELVPLFARPVMGANMTALARDVVARLEGDGVDAVRAGGLLRGTMALVVGLATTGGGSAEQALGPVAADALDVWLRGVRAELDG